MARELMKDAPFVVTEEELSRLPENALTQVDPDVTYTLRPSTQSLIRSLRKKHTKGEWKNHQWVEVFNSEEYADDLIDRVLVDWTGIVSEGQPVPCEREYKVGLDVMVRAALVTRAALNQIVDTQRKDHSFRPTEDVRGVLDR